MQFSKSLTCVYDTQLFTWPYSKCSICPPPAWTQASAWRLIVIRRRSQIPIMLYIVWKLPQFDIHTRSLYSTFCWKRRMQIVTWFDVGCGEFMWVEDGFSFHIRNISTLTVLRILFQQRYIDCRDYTSSNDAWWVAGSGNCLKKPEKWTANKTSQGSESSGRNGNQEPHSYRQVGQN
jgi:hypothetical protein